VLNVNYIDSTTYLVISMLAKGSHSPSTYLEVKRVPAATDRFHAPDDAAGE